jgi:exopolysaccharide production protein ExoZ
MSGLTQTARLHTLDYLRGIAALSIMLYHYCSWSFRSYQSEDFLGRIGIYGVSIFYILSGLTLFHVYFEKFDGSFSQIKEFFVKRFFRIFPLLWLTIFLTIILSRKLPALDDLALNVTGVFSVVRWNNYIGTGVWSIGNELCFYLFFPLFIILAKYNRLIFVLLSLGIFAVYLYFAYILIAPIDSLSGNGWYFYVNPLNQVFLFLSGFLLGFLLPDLNPKQSVSLILILVSLVVFVLYPVEGDRINLIKGNTRVVFTFLCLIICFGFFKLKLQMPSIADNLLSKLGEYSYALYLLHPIVWKTLEFIKSILSKRGFQIGTEVMFLTAVLISLAVSRFSYLYFEKFFMKKAKLFAPKKIQTFR